MHFRAGLQLYLCNASNYINTDTVLKIHPNKFLLMTKEQVAEEVTTHMEKCLSKLHIKGLTKNSGRKR